MEPWEKEITWLAVGTFPFDLHSAFYAPDGLGGGAGFVGGLGDW